MYFKNQRMSGTKIKNQSPGSDDTEAHWLACQREHSAACLRASTEARNAWVEYLRSETYRQWTTQYSCDYGIVSSRFAKHIGFVKWSAVERFFDMMDDSPHIVRDVRDFFVQRGSVRVWWSNKCERIDTSGWFILLPTTAASGGAIDTKLQAYRDQSARVQLKKFDAVYYCRNFEKLAKPIRSRNETSEAQEIRLLIRLSSILDFAKAEVANNQDNATIGNGYVSDTAHAAQSITIPQTKE